MTLVNCSSLVAGLSPPLDGELANQLVDEFVSLERRFIQRDWEAAQLDGGQFCEILGRLLYHQDAANLNRARDFDSCMQYLENDQISHAIQPRRDALHLAKVARTVYKFRSQRGAVHISPNYTPTEMDARFVVEGVRWLMADLLRIYWNGDRELVASAIRELLRFDVPAIGNFAGLLLVQRVGLSAEEEILLLLHYAGDAGFSRGELGRFSQCSPSSVTRAVQALSSPHMRQLILLPTGRYRLTDLGSKRVRDQLADKLVMS